MSVTRRIVVSCVAAVGLIACLPAAGADRGALDGRYRVTLTDADLLAAGVAGRYVRWNHGTYTCDLNGGRWRFSQRAPNVTDSLPWAPYTIDGDRVTFVFRVPGPRRARRLR